MDDREMLRSTVSAMLAERAGSARDEAARQGWSAGLWQLLEESGLTLVSVPESAGGPGGGLRDLATVVQACGYHAAPVPLVETALLAGWVLASAGLAVPPGPLTVVPPAAASGALVPDGPGHRLAGRLCGVPWARAARRILVLAAAPGQPGRTLHAVIDPRDCTIETGTNLAGEPRDTLVLAPSGVDCRPLPAGHAADPSHLRLRGALGRTLLMVGSLRRVLDLTVRYAGEREQFGRPIGRFQAVQQQIAGLAGAVEQAQAITDLAVETLEHDEHAVEVVMAAKICAGHAASVAIAVGHQVHGAIGFTTEHELHLHTCRLMSWRDEYGSESEWSGELGARVTGAGPGGLWGLLTGRAPAVAAR
ncbi:acyl-CoA dehydrogenase family protein [Pseudonocardia bannensis]|uniref:Acyl-CoA/acyl-ACP dehydrogenase n=1 Tax=Pseudonocardia bannensis TaxID=630973 RepID=A0A848DBI2_9PSEU|nr:acyl-CoA dehydrogenase family protein [Pseudonocardia bannensis]NMH90087.1 acyl-CoA/acyl-ACP dehydrogenase [Pseudonocardia bannensis]